MHPLNKLQVDPASNRHAVRFMEHLPGTGRQSLETSPLAASHLSHFELTQGALGRSMPLWMGNRAGYSWAPTSHKGRTVFDTIGDSSLSAQVNETCSCKILAHEAQPLTLVFFWLFTIAGSVQMDTRSLKYVF